MDTLTKATTEYRRAETKLTNARALLYAEITEALADGRTQAEIARVTGLTRERLRQIAKR